MISLGTLKGAQIRENFMKGFTDIPTGNAFMHDVASLAAKVFCDVPLITVLKMMSGTTLAFSMNCRIEEL